MSEVNIDKYTCVENSGNHAGKENEEQRQEFEVGGENAASFGVKDVFSRQCSLNDNLHM